MSKKIFKNINLLLFTTFINFNLVKVKLINIIKISTFISYNIVVK